MALVAALEELHVAFMLLGLFQRRKRAEISPLARTRVDLSRIEPILTGLEFADHGSPPF
jgi:hypothetical protein